MKRSRLEMAVDLLKICSTTRSKPLTRLAGTSMIGYATTKKILSVLVQNGLLLRETVVVSKRHVLSDNPITKKRFRYQLTKQGMDAIQKFDVLKKLLLEPQKGVS